MASYTFTLKSIKFEINGILFEKLRAKFIKAIRQNIDIRYLVEFIFSLKPFRNLFKELYDQIRFIFPFCFSMNLCDWTK